MFLFRDVLQAISAFVRTKATPQPARNVGTTVMRTTQIPFTTTRRSSWKPTSAPAAISTKRVSKLLPHVSWPFLSISDGTRVNRAYLCASIWIFDGFMRLPDDLTNSKASCYDKSCTLNRFQLLTITVC